ncbi:hypothetical protein NS220_06045 [Microbacterium testaceum]|uniref:Uncharacterized protein n=1 Tax=Microbacterium testaceum TaxID=2033 RepID=A0A147EYI7_MICTE|nr:hypothetical protein [Microbacterium testaceum]KTR95362.1 hypothetical protein NS220_06045 [Microbacterium testaceum]
MTDVAGTPPFEPIYRAAVNDAQERQDAIENAHTAEPNSWRALRLRRYWNGWSTVALLKPVRANPVDLEIKLDGQPQEYSNGPGMVPVLLRGEGDTLHITWTDGERMTIAVLIEDDVV